MKNNVANIRNLTSINSVPAVYVESDEAHLTLINANLSGGSPTVAAIDNWAPFYNRNITTAGYLNAIEDRGNNNREINILHLPFCPPHPQ